MFKKRNIGSNVSTTRMQRLHDTLLQLFYARCHSLHDTLLQLFYARCHSLLDTVLTTVTLLCTVCTIHFLQVFNVQSARYFFSQTDASFNIQGYVANKFVCSFPITGLRTRNLARENRGSLLIRHGKLI